MAEFARVTSLVVTVLRKREAPAVRVTAEAAAVLRKQPAPAVRVTAEAAAVLRQQPAPEGRVSSIVVTVLKNRLEGPVDGGLACDVQGIPSVRWMGAPIRDTECIMPDGKIEARPVPERSNNTVRLA